MVNNMYVYNKIKESIMVKEKMLNDENLLKKIKDVASLCVITYKKGGKVLLCGNGGSAADAQHIAAELSGKFNYDRDPLYAEALHVNSSYMTAVANDYDFDTVYSRLIKAIGNKRDILIGISTSGNSKNVINAINEANKKEMFTVSLTGEDGGELSRISDICIKVPSSDTPRIQESHILIGHIICEHIESKLFPKEKALINTN
jgi:D-sedoheptulose 7-phosphate isomerase